MIQPAWQTDSNLGTFPNSNTIHIQLLATPVSPAASLIFTLLCGSLPPGITLSNTGLLSGSLANIISENQYNFVVRAIDDLSNISDKSFVLTVSAYTSPSITTPIGNLLNTLDSAWISYQLDYFNPYGQNLKFLLTSGTLPPGLEINEYGLIRGYPGPPTLNATLQSISVTVYAITNNQLNCYSTAGFTVGRPILFSTSIGGINNATTYYINSIIDSVTFTISSTVNGPETILTNTTSVTTATLPEIDYGYPVIQTFEFIISLLAEDVVDAKTYSITVVNQNTTISQGGPGYPYHTRIPTVLNIRPATYNISPDTVDYSFYELPDKTGNTYPYSSVVNIGTYESGKYFSYKVLGFDFDGDVSQYTFSNIPLGLSADVNTGWITGYPVINSNNINAFTFQVSVCKKINPAISSPVANFSFALTNDISSVISWNTNSNLGTINTGQTSLFSVSATSSVPLVYALNTGSLPVNLELLPSGNISGIIALQPNNTLMNKGDSLTFSFSVTAYSPTYPAIKSVKSFTLTVYNPYDTPYQNLYFKCTPSVSDRALIDNLTSNTSLIPPDYIYRPDDSNFGISQEVNVPFVYGITPNGVTQYINSLYENFYNKNLTLGQIKTAIATDNFGNVLYEVVYSEVIDDFAGIEKSITWPYDITLPDSTQLSVLYPASIENMQNQLNDTLGITYSSSPMPLWMTSQQKDGSTLGFTLAWVICYTLPGYSSIIQQNIQKNWTTPYGSNLSLNQINFKLDRFIIDKSLTYNYANSGWESLPSAQPYPNPEDSKNVYIVFPYDNILHEIVLPPSFSNGKADYTSKYNSGIVFSSGF